MKKWVVLVKYDYSDNYHITELFDWRADALAYIKKRQCGERKDSFRLTFVVFANQEPEEFPAPADKQPLDKNPEALLDDLGDSIKNAEAAAASEV